MERIHDGVTNMVGSITGLGYCWLLVFGLLWSLTPMSLQSGAPDVRTPEPVIYLADNLDEKDSLGWCIDTVGKGFSERLHAHSCKPRGGDVQFDYQETTYRIVSVTFTGKCATFTSPTTAGVTLRLLSCSTESSG